MKPKLVMDTSAIVKWFVEEDERREMLVLRDMLVNGNIEVYVPSLLFIELANALRYIRGLTKDDVIKAVNTLRILGLKIVSSIELLDKSIEIAFRYNMTIYDAIYVALVYKIEAYKLVTYDKMILNNFKNIAVKASQLIKII